MGLLASYQDEEAASREEHQSNGSLSLYITELQETMPAFSSKVKLLVADMGVFEDNEQELSLNTYGMTWYDNLPMPR